MKAKPYSHSEIRNDCGEVLCGSICWRRGRLKANRRYLETGRALTPALSLWERGECLAAELMLTVQFLRTIKRFSCFHEVAECERRFFRIFDCIDTAERGTPKLKRPSGLGGYLRIVYFARKVKVVVSLRSWPGLTTVEGKLGWWMESG